MITCKFCNEEMESMLDQRHMAICPGEKPRNWDKMRSSRNNKTVATIWVKFMREQDYDEM